MVNLTMNTCSFLLEGLKEVITGNETVSIDNQDFLVMKAGHCLMTERFASPSKYRSLLLFFSDKFLMDFCWKHQLELPPVETGRSVFGFHKDPFLQSLLIGLLELNKLDDAVRKKLLPLKFEELMLYLVESHGSAFLASLSSHAPDQLKHLIRHHQSMHKLTFHGVCIQN